MDLDDVVTQVAAAVGLAEGESGIRDVLGAIAQLEPAPVRDVARLAELPVPIVAAACNELRARGVVDRRRPVQLTDVARAEVSPRSAADALAGLGEALQAAAGGAPPPRFELDQAHCTVATKAARVALLHQARALAGQRILLLGDDDLIAVAIATFAARAGVGPGRLAVVDADPAVLEWTAAQCAGTGVEPELTQHDLREPLPGALAGGFDVVMTDPPYTVAGARLFLSRAVAALEPQPGRHVFFSFGARRPDETLAVQQAMAQMGLVIRALSPGFNSYAGAGVLAGTSNLYHLRTAAGAAPLVTGRLDGPLYTADHRAAAARPYRCAGCRAVHEVGPGSRWPAIAALQAAGCPQCGGTAFRPMPLASRPGAAR